MEILEQVKELEKKAKDRDILADKYKELQQCVKTALNALNEIVEIDINKQVKLIGKGSGKQTISDEIMTVVNIIYEDLQIDDKKQISTDDITKYLDANNLKTHTSNLTAIREALRLKDGIHERRQGNFIYMYYFKPSQTD